MTSSAFRFALLNTTGLPAYNVAIDVWIIRNQDIILTQHYQHDEGLNWKFQSFVDILQSRFGQTIEVKKQNFKIFVLAI